VVAALILRRVRRARPAVLTSAVGRLQRLLPASGTEMAGFVVVSVTAGVCEEFLYRGWIVTFLQVATGSVWAAVAIGSVVFGIGHAYQGPKGMLRTGLIGLQLAVLFVMVGSLLPGQVLHAGVDIVSGYALAIAASRLDTSPPPAT
jgi:membrane protease YdiL (CAAX protease family)